MKNYIQTLWMLIVRQMRQMWTNHIYFFTVIVFPLLCVFFFSDIMRNGQPTNLPVGIVDKDNSPATRQLTRTLDAFESVRVAAHYTSVEDARRATQKGDIYGFFYFPPLFNADIQANRQPTVSFYYNAGYLLAGSLVYKDMKTAATLGAAAVASTRLSALGLTDRQILALIEPIVINAKLTHNPTMDYNVYLSTTLIPCCIGIFIFLVTAYSIGTELKFGTAREWMRQSGDDIFLAMLGKMIPQTVLFTAIMFTYITLLFGRLSFPHQCSIFVLLLNGFLFVLAAQGFGIFAFGLLPSLRMSMSVCALWSVLSFSISGFTFPVDAMSPALQTFAWLFPARHYFEIYQKVALNGYSPFYAWPNYLCLIGFALLPFILLRRVKKIMSEYVYIP